VSAAFGAVFRERKPIAHNAEHGGVGDFVLGLRQFIRNLTKW
jgi:hypothetical protein